MTDVGFDCLVPDEVHLRLKKAVNPQCLQGVLNVTLFGTKEGCVMLEKRTKTGLALTPRHLKMCDDNLRRAGARSRNDFVEMAIEFYSAHLLEQDISQMREARGTVPMERFETLSRSLGTGQYKVAVELATLQRMLAKVVEMPDDEVRGIRSDCAREVKHLGSVPTFLQSIRQERELSILPDDDLV